MSPMPPIPPRYSDHRFPRGDPIMKVEAQPTNREVLAGLVERVTYQNADNGFCVVRVKARGHRVGAVARLLFHPHGRLTAGAIHYPLAGPHSCRSGEQ